MGAQEGTPPATNGTRAPADPSHTAKYDFPGSEGEKCLGCGAKETTWHAIGLCGHVGSCAMRDKGRVKIDEVIENGATDEETKEWLRWIYWTSNGSWDRSRAPVAPGLAPGTAGTDPDVILAANVTDLGGQQIWAGVLTGGLHGRLVVRGKMSEDKASKLITKLTKDISH